jgi:KipI family sensor histidine kinase inhibitor
MRTRQVGDHALLVIVDDPREAVAVRSLVLELARRNPAGELPTPLDVVPAARTVLVDGLPDARAVERWRRRLAGEPARRSDEGPVPPAARSHTIDVVYDGPDLDLVARAWRCSRDEVVARHRDAEFLVAFCGFAPGFAYCVARSPLPETPRRAEPRERVAAGSVALAGEYCGVYPAALPGGWQLVGTTAAVMFDAGRQPPALLAPGDTVRFRAAT